MAVYLIEKNLKEDFSPDLPQWLLRFFGLNRNNRYNSAKTNFKTAGINLANANYIPADIPTGGRDPFYKDANKLPVYRLNFNGQTAVYIPGVNDDDNVWVNGRYQRFKNMSKANLLNHTEDFGYIEYDPETDPKNIRKQRDSAKSGVVDRQANAQYKHALYGDKTDEWGLKSYEDDNIVGYEWLTKPGYDKSGYKLDPEKYIRQLNTLGLDSYAQKLRSYYTAIKKTQADFAKAVASADIDNTKYRGYSHWSRNNVATDIRDVADSLERAINAYRDLQQQVTRIVNNSKYSNEQKDEYLRSGWGSSGKQVYDYLKEADAGIKAINTNASWEDD